MYDGATNDGATILDRELNDLLRHETGWTEVTTGLTKVLVGYGILVFGYLLGLMLILMPFIEAGLQAKKFKFGLGHLWMFYAGLGVLSLTGLFAGGWIMAGLWKCAINATERNWCRWLMFFCLTSLAMIMALSILSGLSGMKVAPELKRGVAGFEQVRFSTQGKAFNLASTFLSMMYTGAFVLFLRSAAVCLESRWHVRLADLFLSLFVPLTIVTGYLSLRVETVDPEKLLKPLAFVGLGWVICFVFWIYMIVSVRSMILRVLNQVRDPLTYSGLVLQSHPAVRI